MSTFGRIGFEASGCDDPSLLGCLTRAVCALAALIPMAGPHGVWNRRPTGVWPSEM